MRFTNIAEINDFMATINSCQGTVWLMSPMGDKFVLNSEFSKYVAMAALLTDKGEQLELFCQKPEDEARFFKYFKQYPEV